MALTGSPSISILLVLFSAALFFAYRLVIDPLLTGSLAHIPGPKPAALSWYYLSYFDVRYLCRGPLLESWHDTYGPVVRIRPNAVSLSAPADFHEIYDTKTKYDKTTYFQRFRLYGEDNMFSTINYKDHQMKKRKLAAAYSKSNVVSNAEGIVKERISAFIGELRKAPNGLVDFFVLNDCFSHDVMTRFLYGNSHGTNSIQDPADRVVVTQLKRSQTYSAFWVNFERLHDSELFRAFLSKKHRQAIDARPGIRRRIESLMEAQDRDEKRDEEFSVYRHLRRANVDGQPLSRNYMASEMYDHLGAGQQTTAAVLVFLFWRLSKNEEWQRRLQEEVRSLSQPPSATDVDGCTVLDAVLKETMRLHSVSSNRLERVVPQGGREYSGVFVPEGTTVIGHIEAVQHDARTFPDPLAWRPERWLEAGKEELKAMEYCLVVFGYGARHCIGQHLARLEIALMVATLYGRFSTCLSATSTDEDMEQLSTVTAVPRGLRCELYVTEDANTSQS